MTGKITKITLKAIRAEGEAGPPPRLRLRILAVFVVLEILLVLALAFVFSRSAGAAGVKTEVSVSTDGGFARLVFRFPEEVEAKVRVNNGIVVINFTQPVEIAVDRLPLLAQSYINAARQDPDGTAVRLALGRKVTINSMMAGERLFVDLLPDTWKGVAPGLPQEVVDELARRAREAEKAIRQRDQVVAPQRQFEPIRVRVGLQPTFTRYIFELPKGIAVSTSRDRDKLTLTFDAPVKIDLADAVAALPPALGGIETKLEDDTASVIFSLSGKADTRAFREDNAFIVDVGVMETKGRGEAAADSVRIPDLAGAAPEMKPVPPARPAPPPDVAQRPAPAPRPEPAATPPPDLPQRPVPDIATPAAEPAAQAAGAVASKGTPAQPPGPSAASGASQPRPAPMATVAPSEAKEKAAPRDPRAPVVAEVQRQGDALRIVFPFAVPTPAAVFRRADTLWLVFDAKVPIDITALNEQALSVIRRADIARAPEGQVLRVRLERPRLASAVTEGTTWTVTVGDAVIDPTLPLAITRAIVTPGRSNAIIPFDEPGQFYRLTDPEVGDRLFVVTGLPPARGFLKMQEFIEFNALASTHGIAIQPLADDVSIELAPDKVLINRPGGLTLSAFEQTPHRSTARPVLFDPQAWGFDRQSNYLERQALLLRSAAEAIESRRAAARHDLARFYLARDMYHEAKAVLDVALTEKQVSDDAAPIVLHAIANIMINRPEAALKDLANPVVGSQHDAPLWRALAFARQARWGDALSGFKGAQTALGTLPIELQQLILREHVRAAIEVRDFSDASTTLNELTALNPLQENDPAFAVLTGRLAEGLGRNDEALAAYHKAAESLDRLASVQGRLRELLLRYRLGDLKNAEAVVDLETITTTWRGDETEIEALQLLARLYTSEGRYRDAFQVMRSALLAHPTSDLTRRIHEEAAATFDTLFLEGKGDSLPAIEALGLFYDFRELTSIGRRGDEMIRRLSDRLVAVDLLTQAAELLQHQVDNRLTGAARAQVAVRLAVIYLMNRKPDRALQVLRATRMSDLPGHLRNQRLLIEARALSDTGRPDLALEVVANIEGREAERLRADVLWSARRWVPTAEQIERMLGNRWRDWGPLTGAERTDVLRASIGYVLGEDPMGLDRLREKFEPKMADTPDRRAFEVITAPVAARGNEFREVVKTVAAIDTLEGFLSDMRKSYPETGPLPPNKASPAPAAPAASQTLAPSPTRAAAVQ